MILKIHGAVERAMAPGRLARELRHHRERLHRLPQSDADRDARADPEILSKLRESHFLFLGYRIRDWNLRVFLHRVWGDQQLGAKSWAIVERSRRRGSRSSGRTSGSTCSTSNLAAYLDGLQRGDHGVRQRPAVVVTVTEVGTIRSLASSCPTSPYAGPA